MQRMGFYSFMMAAPTATIQEKVCITRRQIMTHSNIMCSISGGADSDCMLRVVWECDEKNKVKYFFVDTGLEMQATKDHIQYLQELYGIQIQTIYPKTPAAASVRLHGYPFISKQISQYIYRLQKHGFDWSEKSFAELSPLYPRCQAGLKWWCNAWKEEEHKPLPSEIGRSKYLKEFIIHNPPTFHISDHCCQDCKKAPLHQVEKNADLVMTGIRRAEGGARAMAYANCFVERGRSQPYDLHMPLFWWTDVDKQVFTEKFGIIHSRAYIQYGFKRTGCAGCPFNSQFMQELQVLQQYEPQLAKAVQNIFAPSYEYTRRYREYKALMKGE